MNLYYWPAPVQGYSAGSIIVSTDDIDHARVLARQAIDRFYHKYLNPDNHPGDQNWAKMRDQYQGDLQRIEQTDPMEFEGPAAIVCASGE